MNPVQLALLKLIEKAFPHLDGYDPYEVSLFMDDLRKGGTALTSQTDKAMMKLLQESEAELRSLMGTRT